MLQPYTSHDGRPEEKKEQFYIRSGERLRHKGKAILMQDYEDLILENFPEIFRVKCLNHTNADLKHAPGKVTLVMIPNPMKLSAELRAKPAISFGLQQEVKAFLADRVSPYVTLETRNPVYEAIQVSVDVALKPKVDRVYATEEIRQGINRVLNPWMFEQPEIRIGGGLQRSQVLNNIEEIGTVDYINLDSMVMRHTVDGKEMIVTDERVRGSTVASILYAHPSHHIRLVEEEVPA